MAATPAPLANPFPARWTARTRTRTRQLTYTLKTDGEKGSAAVNADGSFTYTADVGVEGTDRFVYTVTDENGAAADGTVTIEFVDNKKPAAGQTAFDTVEGLSLSGNLQLSDADGDSVAAALKTDAAHGELALEADGAFVYTPADSYSGPGLLRRDPDGREIPGGRDRDADGEKVRAAGGRGTDGQDCQGDAGGNHPVRRKPGWTAG